MGGGRSASHVPYPDLAGRHRGQAAIGATGVTGAALNRLFYRSRVQRRAVMITSDASWLLHRAAAAARRARWRRRRELGPKPQGGHTMAVMVAAGALAGLD